MESTGVYWIPLFTILEERRLKIYHQRALSEERARTQSDVSNCRSDRYLQLGRVAAGQPATKSICAIRTLWRHVAACSMAPERVLHMQKALSQMNLQLHHVLSDITGTMAKRFSMPSSQGRRDPVALAQLCHRRVKSPRDKVARLSFETPAERLFTLKQSLEEYHYYQKLIMEFGFGAGPSDAGSFQRDRASRSTHAPRPRPITGRATILSLICGVSCTALQRGSHRHPRRSRSHRASCADRDRRRSASTQRLCLRFMAWPLSGNRVSGRKVLSLNTAR